MRPQNSSTFNPMLVGARKAAGGHHAWLAKHPVTPRRSKSNPAQPPVAPRTALTFAALLAFAHVAEARSAILTSRASIPRPQKGRARREGQPSAEMSGGSLKTATAQPSHAPSSSIFAADRRNGTSTAAAIPIGGKRHALVKRSALAPAAPLDEARPSNGGALHAPGLNGDLPLGEHSLIAARIKAVRKLLGKEIKNREDELMLDIANRIHNDASSRPHDEAASAASLALYKEEAEIWAAENGGRELDLSAATLLEAFKEAWTLALEPPPPPLFKSRNELQERADSLFEEKLERMSYLERLFSGVGIFGEGVNTSREVREAYNRQFSDYISRHLPRLCTAKAISNALEGGLNRLQMEYRPSHVWLVNDVYLRRMRIYSYNPSVWIINQTGEREMPALVFPLPKGDRFGFIGPAGDFRLLDKDIFDGQGRLKQEPILRALDIAFYNTNPGTSVGCLISYKQCHSSYFDFEAVDATENTSSIKEMMESKISKNVLALIERIKEEKYDPSILESGILSLVPFLEVIKKSQDHPEYRIKFKDVAWDLFSLGLTVVPLAGVAAKSLHAGFSAAKAASIAAKGATAAAKASAMVRAFMDGSKTSSFLRLAGRELVDFVIPVFTARDVLRASKVAPDVVTHVLRITGEAEKSIPNLGGGCSVHRVAQQAARRTDDAAAHLEGDALFSIYHQLHKTGGIKRIHTPQMIQKHFDARAELPIPDQLYRSQTGVSISINDKFATQDDYLAAIIKHVAIYAGSGGKAVSLSMSRTVAERFKKRGYNLLCVDTSHDRHNFRTIESILKHDGPRLVADGKLSRGSLAQAIKNAFNEGEEEVFYVSGSIPDEWVEELL